ncbi:MAG: 4-alpha-glucanotransferase [Polyangiaceae bacterium]|nr:4-alpha-glucanotransferase [Polyangiaceae bacterium]
MDEANKADSTTKITPPVPDAVARPHEPNSAVKEKFDSKAVKKEWSRRRVSGVTVPLFSLRTERSWGIGEIGDLPEMATFLAEAGFSLIQLLPLNEIAGGETSPYAALSAFGIDPMFISLADVPDLHPADWGAALGGAEGRRLLERARGAEGVDYAAVRELKKRALRFAFERFVEGDVKRHGLRAAAFGAFVDQHRGWLRDYALFRALKDSFEGKAWWDWPEPLAKRDERALEEARRRFGREIFFFEYQQYVAHEQWGEACSKVRSRGVEVMGDLPFMVGRDSADVWANQGEFRLDMSVGVPPDQFDEDGQDWGLPPYAWSVMTKNHFTWLKRRASYTGVLYDRFRIDHLVGFYRTYMRPWDKRRNEKGKLVKGLFDPAEEADQLAHGERVISAMRDAAAEHGGALVAEDLGTVPKFVRASLAKLGVPGYKVLIWEKDYSIEENPPFLDPTEYPEVSLGCFGTHDTAPVAVWWEGLNEDERAAVKAIPSFEAGDAGEAFTPAVHAALLDLIHGSASELVLLLMQDLLGSRERINTPGTVGEHNWTYRLPAPIAELRNDREIQRIWAMVRESIKKSGRAGSEGQ